MNRGVLLWLISSIAHFVLQFFVWSIHPGNVVRHSEVPAGSIFIRGLWKVLSFPILAIFNSNMASKYFESLLVLNSAIWGLAIALLLGMYHARKSTG